MDTRISRSAVLPLAVSVSLVLAGCRGPAERAGESIADRNAAARGGLEAWRRVHSLSMSGRLEAGKRRDPVQLATAWSRSPAQTRAQARRALAHGRSEADGDQVQLPFTIELKRPRKERVEVQFQGRAAVQVFDGAHGWKVRPFLGRHEVEAFTAEEMRVASQESDLDGLLIDHASKGCRVALVGTEKVEGRDAYKLAVDCRRGVVRHVWVDPQTSLDVMVDGTRRIDGKIRPVWTLLRDYRAEKGLMMPHVLETRFEGAHGSETITVEKVAVNPSLDDSRFARPD